MACSPLGCVTACVVYGRFDSKIRFENESDVRFDSRFDSNEKKTIRRSLIITYNNLASKQDKKISD